MFPVPMIYDETVTDELAWEKASGSKNSLLERFLNIENIV